MICYFCSITVIQKNLIDSTRIYNNIPVLLSIDEFHFMKEEMNYELFSYVEKEEELLIRIDHYSRMDISENLYHYYMDRDVDLDLYGLIYGHINYAQYLFA
jgi:hypothetical protein